MSLVCYHRILTGTDSEDTQRLVGLPSSTVRRLRLLRHVETIVDQSHPFLSAALKGSVSIGTQPEKHEQYYTLVLSSNSNETGIEVTALEDDTEFILVHNSSFHSALSLRSNLSIQVAGEPLDQEVVQYGPFVMTSKEEIQKTFIDCEWMFSFL